MPKKFRRPTKNQAQPPTCRGAPLPPSYPSVFFLGELNFQPLLAEGHCCLSLRAAFPSCLPPPELRPPLHHPLLTPATCFSSARRLLSPLHSHRLSVLCAPPSRARCWSYFVCCHGSPSPRCLPSAWAELGWCKWQHGWFELQRCGTSSRASRR